MKILGIWDGHDSGAALLKDGEVICCLNEERFTRRKLEVHFPDNALREALKFGNVRPEEIDLVAYSTSDPAKTLTRYLPGLKEEYYLVRRRKRPPSLLTDVKRVFKYFLTEFPPNRMSRWLSDRYIRRKLADTGLGGAKLLCVRHHLAHAAAAGFCSGFEECVVISLDGVGDGQAGGVYLKQGNSLVEQQEFKPTRSIGLFFEIVTFLLNMRELEDEGKVMALSCYAHPRPWKENPLREELQIHNDCLLPRRIDRRLIQSLRGLLWRMPAEEFAFYAQQAFEQMVLSVIQKAITSTGLTKLALAGGVFANVKSNMLIRESVSPEKLFVFPHMGDGGLALGSALMAAAEVNDLRGATGFKSAHLGLDFSSEEIESALRSGGLAYQTTANIAETVAELLLKNQVVFWFQGRMEFGPRALGGRSILARPDSYVVRDRLNRTLKRRSWFQPFCPSMLAEEAKLVLRDYSGQDEAFMTSAYVVKEEYLEKLRGVVHTDSTCRPQVIDSSEGVPGRFFDLLMEMRKRFGLGIVLNTSFNLHGEPLVCSPKEAITTFIRSGADYLAIGDYLVTNVNDT